MYVSTDEDDILSEYVVPNTGYDAPREEAILGNITLGKVLTSATINKSLSVPLLPLKGGISLTVDGYRLMDLRVY